MRRQREGWQRDATRQLATGRTGEALDAKRAILGASTGRAVRDHNTPLGVHPRISKAVRQLLPVAQCGAANREFLVASR